jgi:hypothetical protein
MIWSGKKGDQANLLQGGGAKTRYLLGISRMEQYFSHPPQAVLNHSVTDAIGGRAFG